GTCADPNRLRRAQIVAASALTHIDQAKQTLRTAAGLALPTEVRRARTVLRNACAVVSAAFEGLDFDLISNEGHYSPRSTRDVLAATQDPQRNLYRWCLDRLLAPSELGGVQAVGIDLSADSQLVGALTVARFVAEHRPGLPVFAYGDYATRLTMAWQETHPFLDLIGDVIGYEPEQAVVALADVLLDGSTRVVPGRVSAAAGRLRRWAPEPVDLDALPLADFDGLALDRYLGPGPVFPSYASRGCPWRCEFCSIPVTHAQFRRRRPERVADEIAAIVARWGGQYVLFVDETMTRPSLRGVSEQLLARGLEVFWACETRFTGTLDEHLVAQLHRSGCRRIEFGLESYNQRVLDLMRKEVTIEEIDRDVASCLRGGISVHLFGIVGFPGETEVEARRTLDF
ncbi:MAG: B12-binding domain-containing radical SAM protein, partial [Sporichthyaceae bacterium]|nr:B12-binding domain-containing radical SAM protein [Sporichthyaceae bacterium]